VPTDSYIVSGGYAEGSLLPARRVEDSNPRIPRGVMQKLEATGKTFTVAALALTLAASLFASSGFCVAQTTTPAAPKAQLPADRRALKAAEAQPDPEQRLTALRKFVKDYPKSKYRHSAESRILDTLLKNFPDRAKEIDAQAKLAVKGSGKGMGRWYGEADVADRLANAGPNGVDLTSAAKWAKDAVDHDTEAAYDKETAAEYKKFKQPPPKPDKLHQSFAEMRAELLAAQANVALRQGKLDEASAELNEANTLDSMVDEVSALRGEIALIAHHDAEALDDFERAQLLGELRAPLRPRMMELYRQAHAGSDANFVTEMDAKYAQLYPAPFAPKKHEAISGGHTVLVELFTGSACPPCVGMDLAVDGMLEAYPRNDVVALAFDQHIPEPDPLTNPASVARAELYSVNGTPTVVVDGGKPRVGGEGRAEAEELYTNLAKTVDAVADIPSGVQMKLTAETAANGSIHAQAVVTAGTAQALTESADADQRAEAKLAAAEAAKAAAEASPAKKQKKAKTAPAGAKPAAVSNASAAGAPVTPQLVVNFALVEDDIRYSGENGVRFHRMVVRSLAKPADSGFALELNKTATEDATFDPAAISKDLTDYLTKYEQTNDRFGKIEFISKDTAMQPSHLGVAAWVQDTTTHRVLQAAYVPLEAK
jgi:thiol-disulfide isomerase/thioredoxin